MSAIKSRNLLSWALLLHAGFSSAFAYAGGIEFGIAEHSGVEQCLKDSEAIRSRHCVFYHRVRKTAFMNFAKIPSEFSLTLALKFPQEHQNVHADIIKGDFDDDLKLFAKNVKAIGRKITLRIMPEGNGWWNSDAGYFGNQSPESYTKAYTHIVELMREVAGDAIAEYELNLNVASYNHSKKHVDTSSFEKFNAGPGLVDRVSFSVYNRCGTSPEFKKIKSFSQTIAPAYNAAQKYFPKAAIGIAEVASSPYCSVNLVHWYTNMLSSIEKKFSKIDRVIFFFQDVAAGKSSNTVNTRWGAILESDPSALRALIVLSRSKRSKSSDEHPSSDGSSGQKPSSNKESGDKAKPRSKRTQFPWSIWGYYSYNFGGTENDGINPMTGDPFGKLTQLVYLQLKQGVMWSLSESLSFGPTFNFNMIRSPNPNMWWDNKLAWGSALGLTWKLPSGVIEGGKISFDLFAEQFTHTTEAPQYSIDNNKRYGGRVTVYAGGDWAKN